MYPYQCPLCQQPLNANNMGMICSNNHQFDRAKEGYINLLPVQHKNSKAPGDNQEMTAARRAFLASGHYQPLQNSIVDVLDAHLNPDVEQLLDIGCGEGYYTSALERLKHTRPNLHIHGADIAKVAVRYAAKRYPQCHFAVASSARLPFISNSIDAVVRIFAPSKLEQLHNILVREGILLIVTPAARHLYQLKELIYDPVRLHQSQPEQLKGFELIKEHRLNYNMALSSTEAQYLLAMTPFAWKANPSVIETLKTAHLFDCEADFSIHLYRKQ